MCRARGSAVPSIEVLGVYALEPTEEQVDEQADSFLWEGMSDEEEARAIDHVRAQIESVCLIELVVRDRDERFSADDFAQAPPGTPPGSRQVAYLERYLTADGEELAAPLYTRTPPEGDLRVAFFMHFWDPALPLATSYGEVRCPEPEHMPERLRRVAPWVPTD